MRILKLRFLLLNHDGHSKVFFAKIYKSLEDDNPYYISLKKLHDNVYESTESFNQITVDRFICEIFACIPEGKVVSRFNLEPQEEVLISDGKQMFKAWCLVK